MGQVTVTIAGRTYRMACGDGDERHLEALAAGLDGRIDQMRGAFGDIGEARLQVMAALALADELDEARSRLAALEERCAALEGEIGALRARANGPGEPSPGGDGRAAEAIVKAAERIERLARMLSGAHAPAPTP